MSKYSIVNGLIKENPTFVLLLGMCPTLGTTSSAINGLSMGLATMVVLICSNFVISCVKNLIPDKVHIPCYIVIIAGFVTVVQLLLKAYAPAIDETLGLFIPLIVVNCIVLGRAESFAAKNNPLASICDGIGIGLGFSVALTLIGLVRELLGSGVIFKGNLVGLELSGINVFSEDFGALIFILAPGAFITLGYLVAVFNKVTKKA